MVFLSYCLLVSLYNTKQHHYKVRTRDFKVFSNYVNEMTFTKFSYLFVLTSQEGTSWKILPMSIFMFNSFPHILVWEEKMEIQASCHRSGMTNVIIPVKNNPFRSNINLEYTFTECIFIESVKILSIQPVAGYWAMF